MQSSESIDESKLTWPKPYSFWDEFSFVAPIVAGYLYLCLLSIWHYFFKWIDLRGDALVDFGVAPRSGCAPRGVFYLTIFAVPVIYMYCLLAMAMRRIGTLERALSIAASVMFFALADWILINDLGISSAIEWTIYGLTIVPAIALAQVRKGSLEQWEYVVQRLFFVPIVLVAIVIFMGDSGPGFCSTQYSN